ncbi:lactosylceramide 4-alpha-galactosyltransferase-like [Impatiens glandulifera]|uniref:lactosylceramide 4-alpha-galactosyltransferase-like n=1 Tax=Impatiens glandulifera TaxID=253017 RepID=UPI001FB050AE|nr:lactosylceramide 4-alpha-galactosyltransferase-like [Impatiens glandulifera]
MSESNIWITSTKSPFFSTVSFVVVFLVVLFVNTFSSKLSLSSFVHRNSSSYHLVLPRSKTNYSTPIIEDNFPCIEPIQLHSNLGKFTRNRTSNKVDIDHHIELLNSINLNGSEFEFRVKEFLSQNECMAQFFMIWISPACLFKRRAFLAMESVFNSHPRGCLVILSKSMDTQNGSQILKPIVDHGYKVLAVEPNLTFLFKDTPAETWLNAIKTGLIDPGKISLVQNLSNLMRLAVLYKYGGVYIDTDFIVLRNFSNLRNAIGAQGIDEFGNWTRLNNAVLVFDKNHELVYKFMEEFANNFNGNIWGFNGPYLVSRVVEKEGNNYSEIKLRILPPRVVYPVNWIDVASYFEKPRNVTHLKWMDEEVLELNREAYGVHLWNKKSGKLIIEVGSILYRLISSHCIICQLHERSEND